MRTAVTQQKINLISVICAILGFFILLVCWDQITSTKRIMLAGLNFLFIFIILRNRKISKIGKTKVYGKLKAHSQGQQKNDTLVKIANFLTQVSDRQSEQKIPYGRAVNKYYNDQSYISQRSFQSRITQNNEKPEYQINRQGSYGTTRQLINIQVTGNIASISEKIKEKISPNKYFQQFEKINYLERSQNNKASQEHSYLQSFVLVEGKLLVTKQHDVFIQRPLECAQAITDYLQTHFQNSLNMVNLSFKQVSQITMKCFGLKVKFFNNSHQKFSNQITIQDLNKFLDRVRKQIYMTDKFNPTMPIKQFVNQYLGNLTIATDRIMKFQECLENPDQFAFKMYLFILKEQFYNERIQITKNLSASSNQLRKIQHCFFIHSSSSWETYVTYNKIEGFKTINPIVAFMAFFTEIYKNGQYKDVKIVKEVNKYIKKK